MFDGVGLRMWHFVGGKEISRVFAVLYINSVEYVGVATDDGIEVYGPDGYERRI